MSPLIKLKWILSTVSIGEVDVEAAKVMANSQLEFTFPIFWRERICVARALMEAYGRCGLTSSVT